MISERIGTWAREKLLSVGAFLGGLGLTPNLLTIIGFLLNCAVAAIIASGNLRLGGVLLLFSSGFDMLDGPVARATGKTSKFGGFFDSTVDRYSEIVVYVGLLYHLLDTDDWKTGAILTLLAATGAIMISYARARAEAQGWKAAVGLLARTERVVLLSLGLVIGKPVWALWILAIGTHLTAVTRMIHVWRIAEMESAAATAPATATSSDAPTS